MLRLSWRERLVVFLICLLLFSTFAVPTKVSGASPGFSTGTAPKTILVSQTAEYTLTLTNLSVIEDTFTFETSNSAVYWTSNLTRFDKSTPVGTLTLAIGTATTLYCYVKPSAAVPNGGANSTTLTVTANSGGSTSLTLTTTSVHAGFLLLSKSVSPKQAKIGDSLSWNILVQNTGSDTVGHVSVTDTLGVGSSFSSVSFSTTPSSWTATQWVFAEIPPNQTLSITLTSTVAGCLDIDNSVEASWGVPVSQTTSAVASVQYIAANPDINFTAKDIQVPLCSLTGTTVEIPIKNDGDGLAQDFKLTIDKIPTGTCTVIIADSIPWSYDEGTGEFTYLAGTPTGRIDPSATVTLSFTVMRKNAACQGLDPVDLIYHTDYIGGCGTPFIKPTQLARLSFVGTFPSIEATKSTSPFVTVGDVFERTFTITVTYNKGDSATSTIAADISDTVPAAFAIVGTNPSATSTVGQAVTWSNVILTDGTPSIFQISYTVTDSPCAGGREFINTVTVTGPNNTPLLTPCGCPMPVNVSPAHVYVNSPRGAIASSSKTVNPATQEVECSTATTPYANPSGNPDPHNNRLYANTYVFQAGTASAPSSWSGIIFTETASNLQSISPTFAAAKVEVSGDNGSSWTDYASSLTISSPTVPGSPLVIDLSGLESSTASKPNGGTTQLRISYTARPTQTDTTGNPAVSYSYIDWSTLEAPGFPSGCTTSSVYYQGVPVTDLRATLSLSIDVPRIVNSCTTYTVTVNLSPSAVHPDAVSLTLSLTGFEYQSGTATFSSGGTWCPTRTHSEPTVSGNDLTWPSSSIGEIVDNGSISFLVHKDCTTLAEISGTASYLDNCSHPHTATALANPSLTLTASLSVLLTPQLNFGVTRTVSWVLYVVNSGDGAAFSPTIFTELASGLTFTDTALNAIEIKSGATTTSYTWGDPAITWPAFGSSGYLAWVLNNVSIPAGARVTVRFNTSLNTCEASALTATSWARWCSCNQSNNSFGRVVLPNSDALFTLGDARVYVCGNGDAWFQITNVGGTHIYNSEFRITLPKYLHYKANSTTASLNGVATATTAEPVETATSGGYYDGGWDLTWSPTQIPALADLGTQDSLVLHFQVEADTATTYAGCKFLKTGYHQIRGQVLYGRPCSPSTMSKTSNIIDVGTGGDIVLDVPNLTLAKSVIQVDGQNANQFPLQMGSTVLFQLLITNTGTGPTGRTDLAEVLTPSGAHKLLYLAAGYRLGSSGSWSAVPWTATTATVLIWNNIEATVGSLTKNQTLTITVLAQIDPTCTGTLGINYGEIWTGCPSDLTAMTADNLLLQNVYSGSSGAISSPVCPIYQGYHAAVRSHENSTNFSYSSTIASPALVCTTDTYLITFTNTQTWNGGVTLYGPLRLWDLLPPGVSYRSGATEYSFDGGSSWTPTSDPTQTSTTLFSATSTLLDWTLTSNLTVGQSLKLRFGVQYGNCSQVPAGTVYNRQRIAGYDCQGTSGSQYWYPDNSVWNSNSGNWKTSITVERPNITLTKSADRSVAAAGDALTYTLQLTNTGTEARSFALTDTLPADLTMLTETITYTSYPWVTQSFVGNTLTLTSALANGEFPGNTTLTVTFQARIGSSVTVPVTNTVAFTFGCCAGASTATTVGIIGMIKSVTPTLVQRGSTLTYTIEYWLDGPQPTTGTFTEQFSDYLDTTTLTASPPPTSSPSVWALMDIPNDGVHRTITITCMVKNSAPSSTTIPNTVTLAYAHGGTLTATAENKVRGSSPVTFEHTIAPTTLVCSSSIPFIITFHNASAGEGGSTIHAPLTILDLLPFGATYLSGTSSYSTDNGTTWNNFVTPTLSTTTYSSTTYKLLTWQAEGQPAYDIPPSGTFSVRFLVNFGNCQTFEGTDTVTNVQRLAGYNTVPTPPDFYWYPNDGEWTTTGSWVTPITLLKPQINLEKTADRLVAAPGDRVTYTLRLQNSGTGEARGFSLTDTLPAGTSLIPGSIVESDPWLSHSVSGETITWSSTLAEGALPVGANVTASFQIQVKSWTQTSQTNKATFSTPCCGSLPAVSQEVGILRFWKSAPQWAQPGSTLVYTLHYQYDGPLSPSETPSEVVVRETYNAYLSFSSATPTPNSGTDNVWTLTVSDTAPHAITITCIVKESTPSWIFLTNTATLSYHGGGSDPFDISTSAQSRVKRPSDLPSMNWLGGSLLTLFLLGSGYWTILRRGKGKM